MSRPDQQDWLPTTAYAVLGLLAVGDEHTAYELKQLADRTIAHVHWAPAMSAVYTELKRLGDAGLVAHRDETGEGRPRRLHSITDAGSARLRDWVEQAPLDPTTTKNTMLLRVLFGADADPAVLADRLAEHVSATSERLTDLHRERTRVTDASDDEGPLAQTLVLEAAVATLEAEIAATERILDRVRRSGPAEG